MVAGRADLVIEQDATFSRLVTWTDANSNPIDLTGFFAKMTISYTVNGATNYFTIDSFNAGGITINTPATSGKLTLTIPATTTKTFTWQTGAYDLLVMSSASTVTRLIEGNVTVDPAVTFIV